MSAPFEPSPSRVGFCSAPWTDCITYADGELKACDRNVASFGNWQKGGLRNTWHSEKFQEFRQAVREGRYPDSDCASCHNNGTQRTAHSSMVGALVIHYAAIRRRLGLAKDDPIPAIENLRPLLLHAKTRSAESDTALAAYFAFLERLHAEHGERLASDKELRDAIRKLRVIGETFEDYLAGALKPRRVATFRQSQLQAKCTARCVMCAGLYTGELENGPTLGSEWVDEAFAAPDDITDFWCNGSEYLFYKDWKKIALMLHEEGVKTRVSTNGILLTEQNIDFLVDNKLLGFITLSLDGATKETMETTRVRVNFDKNVQRIRYLLKRATEEGQRFEFTAAFVMMKRNLHELPAFLRLLKSLMPEGCTPPVAVLPQPLENFNIEGYRRFVHREHHSLLGEARLRELFLEADEIARQSGIAVAFYNQNLKDFIADGMPFPKYFPREMDCEIFRKALREGEPLWAPDELDAERLAARAGHDEGGLARELLRFARDYCASNAVIAATRNEFPAFAAELEAALPGYAGAIAARFAAETVPVPGTALRAKKLTTRAFRAGDSVYSPRAGRTGKVLGIRGGLVLLHDAACVPRSGLLHLSEPLEAPGRANRRALARARVYIMAHAAKNKVLGNVKSPTLWKLSQAWRKALGVNVSVGP